MKPVLFHLETGCRVTLNGIPMTIKDVTYDKVQLARKDSGQKVSLSRFELASMASESKLVFVDGLAVQPVLREAQPVPWDRLDADKRARIDFRMAYVKALIKINQRSPNNPVFRMALEAVARRRGDDPAPSPFTVYRWLRNYRASGYNSDALAREYATKKGRSARIPPEVRELIEQKLMVKMSNPGATLSEVYETEYGHRP